MCFWLIEDKEIIIINTSQKYDLLSRCGFVHLTQLHASPTAINCQLSLGNIQGDEDDVRVIDSLRYYSPFVIDEWSNVATSPFVRSISFLSFVRFFCCYCCFVHPFLIIADFSFPFDRLPARNP